VRLVLGKRLHYNSGGSPLCGAIRQGVFGKQKVKLSPLDTPDKGVNCKRCLEKLRKGHDEHVQGGGGQSRTDSSP
jgi:hypothetical protein